MKSFLLVGLLVAVDVNSCNDANVVQRMQERSAAAERACTENHGVPIYQTNQDQANSTYFDTIARCDFPQTQLRGER